MKKSFIRTFGPTAAIALATLAGAAHAAQETFKVDAWHTTTTFAVVHNGTSTNTGKFPTSGGLMMLDTAAKKGSVDVTIDVAGVVSGIKLFDEHLRSEKWLDTAKHPTATFKSTKFEFKADKVEKVHGHLTFKGVTRPVELEAKNFNCYDNAMFKAKVCGGDFETKLKSGEFGFPFEVKLSVQVEGVKQ